MSNEIATYSMILSKLSLGKSGTECPTKTQILAINSLIVIDNTSTYGANECVKIDDIRKKAETWNYYLTVSPTSMSFGAGGGSKSFTVSSYKRKVLDGVEQSGDTSVSLKSTTISGTGFSLSGTTVSASANEITSNRTGTVTITQNESNKTVTISLSQDGDDVSSYGEWTISVSASPTSVSSSGGTSTITASATRTVYWTSGDVTEETGNPALSTNLGSLSSSSSPSTLTLGENTSTSSRTATIKATHGGKSATCTVTQAGAEPTIEYVFTISPRQVNVGASGGTGDIGFTSYKLVNGNQISLGYSIDSSTLPSWATYSNGRFTISSNSSTSSRSVNVYFQQEESGKRDYATISQSGYVPPADTYVFTITPNTYDVPYSNASFIPRTVSTKNGSNIGYSLTSGSTDWVVVDTTGKITVEILENTASSTRSTTLVFTQNESGNTQSIEITQSGRTPTYTFNVTPTNLSVDAITNTYSFTVNSSKTILNVDGSESSERIGWTGTDDADWIYLINASNRPNQIGTVTNETTLQRTAKITLTQDGTGIQAFVNVIQEAGVESNNELYINSTNYDSVHLFGNGEVPHSGSPGQPYFLVSTGAPIYWKTSIGLVVNGGAVYAGDTISVYVSSNNSYTLLRTFALETGVQRVIV